MLLTKEVEVSVGSGGTSLKRYEKLGYKIPRRLVKGKLLIEKEAKIKVKVADLPNSSNKKIQYECDKCHNIVTVSYSNFYNSQKRLNFSGKTYCVHCASSIYNSGEQNHMYNKNLTDEQRNDKRESIDYTIFHRTVLQRDNYTCQCCGYKNNHKKDIVVHHLYSYDVYKDLRNEVSNGITLCTKCHKSFHAKYGSGCNTKEQFEEWLPFALQNLEYDGELLTTKVAYCIEDKEVINSVGQYCYKNNKIKPNYIYMACNGKRGNVFGKHYLWYDDFIKMSDEEVKIYLDKCARKSKTGTNGKAVINLDTKILYSNILTAIKYTHPNSSTGTFSDRVRKGKTFFGERWVYLENYDGDISIFEKVGDFDEIE